jgi:MFS family permease
MDRSFTQAEVEYRAQHDPLICLRNSLPANFPIERARLKHLFWILPLFIVGTAVYGLSLNSTSLVERPGWIAVPLVLQFIIAATSNAVFAINQTLVSDLCPGKGASSTAINNLFRCSISAMGVEPAFVSLGLVTIIVSPLCVFQWYWAMSWRVGKGSSK